MHLRRKVQTLVAIVVEPMNTSATRRVEDLLLANRPEINADYHNCYLRYKFKKFR